MTLTFWHQAIVPFQKGRVWGCFLEFRIETLPPTSLLSALIRNDIRDRYDTIQIEYPRWAYQECNCKNICYQKPLSYFLFSSHVDSKECCRHTDHGDQKWEWIHCILRNAHEIVDINNRYAMLPTGYEQLSYTNVVRPQIPLILVLHRLYDSRHSSSSQPTPATK